MILKRVFARFTQNVNVLIFPKLMHTFVHTSNLPPPGDTHFAFYRKCITKYPPLPECMQSLLLLEKFWIIPQLHVRLLAK